MDSHFDTQIWAELNFGQNNFGDIRLTNRCVQTAQAMMRHAGRSIYGTCLGDAADCAAAYRFMRNEATDATKVTKTHRDRTREKITQFADEAESRGEARPTVLLLGDSSDVIFGLNRQIKNGKSICQKNCGPGFILHPNLAVNPDTGEIYGIASLDIRDRKPTPIGEDGKPLSTAQRAKLDDRESRIWSDAVDQLGPPVPGVTSVCVNDRGADIYEYFGKLRDAGYSFVVRASQMDRVVFDPKNPERGVHLRDFAMTHSVLATYDLEVTQTLKGKRTSRRTARMEVRVGSILFPSPKYAKKAKPIRMNFVYLLENKGLARDAAGNPCAVAEPLDWFLLTDLPAETEADAMRVRDFYQDRWLIEELFHAMKTGCGLENSKLRDMNALKTLTGFFAVSAVFLLQLKRLQHVAPDTDVYRVVPETWVRVLELKLKLTAKKPILTVSDFYLNLARLGGYLARKSDPPPGWKILWRGWLDLLPLAEGFSLAMEMINESKNTCV
jgi:hypothetical protein